MNKKESYYFLVIKIEHFFQPENKTNFVTKFLIINQIWDFQFKIIS